MSKFITGKGFAKNVIMSVGVQAVSLIVGFVLNLVVPKFIGEYDYANWQSYTLYMQYLGLFHFGFMDGFVLRYSEYDYDELDKSSVRSQFCVIIAIDAVISVIMLVLSLVFLNGVNRVIGVLLAFTVCIEIIFNFVSFSFQTTNRIKQYAAFSLVNRLVYGALTIAFVVFGFSEYYWFCIAHIVAVSAVIACFGFKYSKELFFGELEPFRTIRPELSKTLSAGVWLMISSYAANFLVGSGKMTVQWFWDKLTFGKVSLAFSLCSFVLQFVTAISVVLFPSMKRMEGEKLPDMYVKIRQGISPILFFALILYFPGSIILEMWLPKYADSVVFLGILMPIIIFTTKVSLLTNNYLKAYRKEKTLLVINLSIVAVFFTVFMILGIYVKNLVLLLLTIVFAIMIRSFVSEMAVMRVIGKNLIKDFFIEFIMTMIFVISIIVLDKSYAFLCYGVALVCYFIYSADTIVWFLRGIKSIIKRF